MPELIRLACAKPVENFWGVHGEFWGVFCKSLILKERAVSLGSWAVFCKSLIFKGLRSGQCLPPLKGGIGALQAPLSQGPASWGARAEK